MQILEVAGPLVASFCNTIYKWCNLIQATYEFPVNLKQDYQECLDEVKFEENIDPTTILILQVKRGVQPRTRTMTYHAPADSELGLYDELKNLKIPNIPGSSIE